MHKHDVVYKITSLVNDDEDVNEYLDYIMKKNYPNVKYDEDHDDGVYYAIRQSILNDLVILGLAKSINEN